MSQRHPNWKCTRAHKPTQWYTNTSCQCGACLVVVGGIGQRQSNNNNASSVYIYHIDELEWLKAHTRGIGPKVNPAYSASSGRKEDGTLSVIWTEPDGPQQMFLSTMQLSEMEWNTSTISLSHTNPPVRGYSVNIFEIPDDTDTDILLFGGEDHLGYPTNDCLCVSSSSMDENAFVEVINDGNSELPPPRTDHATTMGPDNNIVLQGGKGVDDELLGDLWIFDPSRKSWTQIQEHGPPRCGHAISATKEMILLFGGVDSQGLATNDLYIYTNASWKGPIYCEGPMPSVRAGHLFSLVYPDLKESYNTNCGFVLHGGVSGPSAPTSFNDVHRLIFPKDIQNVVEQDSQKQAIPDSRPGKIPRTERVASLGGHSDSAYTTKSNFFGDVTQPDKSHAHHLEQKGDLLDALEQLKRTANDLDEKERRIQDLELQKKSQERQLTLDRDKLEIERNILTSKMADLERESKKAVVASSTGYAVYSSRPARGPPVVYQKPPPVQEAPADLHRLEFELQQERQKVAGLVSHLAASRQQVPFHHQHHHQHQQQSVLSAPSFVAPVSIPPQQASVGNLPPPSTEIVRNRVISPPRPVPPTRTTAASYPHHNYNPPIFR